MRLPIPAIFSLMLSLPYAFAGNTLATPLTVTLVTDYADGWVDILNPGKTDTINIKTSTHTIPVDGVDIWHVHDYPFDVVDVTNIQQFRVRRSSWGARESICDLSVVADPLVPYVHIMLVGEQPEDIRVNGHEDAVRLSCRVSSD